jgi:lactate dehydrogenase-like 2-hydroxyacid dehydrogenase
MALIYVTRNIPGLGVHQLKEAGHEVVVSEKNDSLTHEELLEAVASRPYEGIVSLLSDAIDETVFQVAPHVKIVANYAVGYNNISLPVATERGVVVTNTPDVLTDTVAEFTIALMLAVTKRIVEADVYMRGGKYTGWGPELMLGSDLKDKTLGIVGAGRIGSAVALRAKHGFGMQVRYTSSSQAENLDAVGCQFCDSLEELLAESDVVSLHVPLVPATKHLMNAERFAQMKSSAYLINTSRGPVIDEIALVSALKQGTIRGAGLDVYEFEPEMVEGLAELSNVVLTPHIASASEETRSKMSEMVAENINAFFSGKQPPNQVQQ